MKNKPVKWGFKSFCVCDSSKSYHWNFEIYTGQQTAAGPGGLIHDLVLRLLGDLLKCGYWLFTDNYYTSPTLAESLMDATTQLVGTLRCNRTGVPKSLRDVKTFERKGKRGDMRYVRNNCILYLQWLDKRSVSLLSTVHCATDHNDASRMVRVEGEWQQQSVSRPKAVADYNRSMGGVDQFDQLASSYRLLRRSKKSWRVIFCDLLEICVINSFTLMMEYKSAHPDKLPRPRHYAQESFRMNLVKQLAGISDHAAPPASKRGRRSSPTSTHEISHHLPIAVEKSQRGNCKLCWSSRKIEQKSAFQCSTCVNQNGTPVFLCLRPDRQCFQQYHEQ